MKKLCFVATIPAVVHTFFHGHIQAASAKWSTKVVSAPTGAELLNDLQAEFIPIEIERKISIFKDISALVRLIALFRRERFDLVHSIMPKTGLLSMVAGWLAGVPIRVHTFTGQVWVTRQGWRRGLLKLFDRLIARLATHVLVDSPSQRDFLVSEGVLPPGKSQVIGQGSICGVDPARFHPDVGVGASVRAELGIGLEQCVILFLGRLNRDKGILDLAVAFAEIVDQNREAVLLLVGAEEDVPFSRMQEICGKHRARLYRAGFTLEPERYMAAADIFCLPSYREGFGQVILEAAASDVPCVASHIYGVTDAVEDGKTGLLFPAGDVPALTQALLRLLDNAALRCQMGENARIRALEMFSEERVVGEMMAFYDRLLTQQHSCNS